MGASPSSSSNSDNCTEEEEQLVASSGGSLSPPSPPLNSLPSSNCPVLLSSQITAPLNSPLSSPTSAHPSRPASGSTSTSSSIRRLDFLKGYNKCCARMQASSALSLFRLYSHACSLSGIPCGLEFDPDSDKFGGFFTQSDLMMIFSMCWLMERSWRVKGCEEEKVVVVVLPDLTHLVLSALQLEGDGDSEGDVLGSQRKVIGHAVSAWMVRDVPGIGEDGEAGGEEGEERVGAAEGEAEDGDGLVAEGGKPGGGGEGDLGAAEILEKGKRMGLWERERQRV